MLNVLPLEILIKILSYLDYKDLVSLSRVNSLLYQASTSENLWKVQNYIYWCSSELEKEEVSWREHFVNFYISNGRYIDCYKHIKKAWDKILFFMSQNLPRVRSAINEGISERELNEAEGKLGIELPNDLRCSMRIHNGQRLNTMGLLGSVYIQNHFRSESLLDLATALSCQFETMFNGCIPLSICVDSGVAQFLALKDINGIKKGTVFYPSDTHTSLGCRHFCAFISANSYQEWLTTFSKQLENDEFLVDSQLYRFPKISQVEETTNHITVTVRTCFMPELSSVKPNEFFHTYRIRMSMAADAPKSESCQLETRHWIVIDDDGHEERVDGLGVVGKPYF